MQELRRKQKWLTFIGTRSRFFSIRIFPINDFHQVV